MSSLRQRVRLELEDETKVEVTYDGRDLRAWELAYNKSSLTEDMSLSMLTWLGWHAAKRQGLLNGDHSTFKAMDRDCVSVQGIADVDRPTKPGARTPKDQSDG